MSLTPPSLPDPTSGVAGDALATVVTTVTDQGQQVVDAAGDAIDGGFDVGVHTSGSVTIDPMPVPNGSAPSPIAVVTDTVVAGSGAIDSVLHDGATVVSEQPGAVGHLGDAALNTREAVLDLVHAEVDVLHGDLPGARDHLGDAAGNVAEAATDVGAATIDVVRTVTDVGRAAGEQVPVTYRDDIIVTHHRDSDGAVTVGVEVDLEVSVGRRSGGSSSDRGTTADDAGASGASGASGAPHDDAAVLVVPAVPAVNDAPTATGTPTDDGSTDAAAGGFTVQITGEEVDGPTTGEPATGPMSADPVGHGPATVGLDPVAAPVPPVNDPVASAPAVEPIEADGAPAVDDLFDTDDLPHIDGLDDLSDDPMSNGGGVPTPAADTAADAASDATVEPATDQGVFDLPDVGDPADPMGTGGVVVHDSMGDPLVDPMADDDGQTMCDVTITIDDSIDSDTDPSAGSRLDSDDDNFLDAVVDAVAGAMHDAGEAVGDLFS